MTFPNVLAVILGIEENDIQSDITIIIPGIDSHQGLFHPKLSLLYPDFILIYLEDLVEFSTVGGVEISLLKIIPAPPFNSDHETYHFDFCVINLHDIVESLIQSCLQMQLYLTSTMKPCRHLILN